jgi:hypothetical protein
VDGINIPTIIVIVAFISYLIYEWRHLHRIKQAMRQFVQENGLTYDHNGRLTGIYSDRDIIIYSANISSKHEAPHGWMVTTANWTIIEADVDNTQNVEFYLAKKLPFPEFLNDARGISSRLSKLPKEEGFFHVKNNGIQYRWDGVVRDATLLNHILDLMCDIAEAVERVDVPVVQTLS